MRYVCQRNSKLPPQVQKFNIELLANDLNKLGFNIRLTDSRGNRLSNDKICNEIYKARPDVEGVCMANSGSVSSTRVAELVKYFNTHFGTNIAVTENPMDPNSKKRSIPDLCDDMYMVQDKISRKLTDNVNGVKRSLLEQIEQLKLQQRILDESFSRHLGMLRNGPEMGTDMDQINDKLRETTAIRQALIGEMGRQIHSGTSLVRELESQLDSRFYPNIRHVRGVLDQYANTPFNGDVRNVMIQTNNTISGIKALGVGMEHFKGCMDKLNISETELNNDEKYEELLEKAHRVARSNAGTDSELAHQLNTCYNNLRHARGIIKGAIQKQKDLREAATGFGINLATGSFDIEDAPDPLLIEDNELTRELTREGSEVLREGGARSFVGGGEDNRDSFWVDADASESAFVY
jgi:hypothetical protein